MSNIQLNVQQILKNFQEGLLSIKNTQSLIEYKNIFTKNNLSKFYSLLKNLDKDEKKRVGAELNLIKNSIDDIFNKKLLKLQEQKDLQSRDINYDPNINIIKLTKGSLHLLNIVQNDIIDFFKKLNFNIIDGEELVEIKDNFDNLNINVDHPARQTNDSFYLSSNNLKMLRTHCTANTAKVIANKNTEVKVLSFGNVYRNDDDDPTHSHQFRQIDFVWIKDGLNISNLKWIIDSLLKHIFGQTIKTRYRLSYFPFTEPSFEVDISCFNCNGVGCKLCKESGYIEVLGAGMLHQNVLSSANITFTKTALAAGVGLDRIAMLKYGIKDIRNLYNNDFRIINQIKGGVK